MFKKIGKMIVIEPVLIGQNQAVIHESSIGVCFAFRHWVQTSFFGEQTFAWTTIITYSEDKAFGIRKKCPFQGNLLFDFSEVADVPNTGVVELSENVIVYGKFPIAVEYVTTHNKNLEIGLVNQQPKVNAEFHYSHDAQSAASKILRSKMRLITPEKRALVEVEKSFE